jgi:trehalose 6-phosphate phosphatase
MKPLAALAPGAAGSAWFLDVDGTLLELAPRPDLVAVPPGLVRDLEALTARAGGALALVSGRSIAALDALFAPLKLAAAGCHGAEMRFAPDGGVVRSGGTVPLGLRGRLERLAAAHGLLLEDKEVALALHYRGLADPAAALAALESERAAILAEGYELMPGHQVLEVRRPGLHKGAALDALMAVAPFAGKRPLFAGDDVTDEDAFRHLAPHDGIGIAVGVPRAGAAFQAEDPAAFRRWLHRQAAD